jgi:Mrp family chromosome partitioning ATPase/capsular polysaccharide biosynthesis protein
MSDPSQTNITDYLRVLRRSRWLILGTTLLFAFAAVAYVVLKTPNYEATAQETVNDPSTDLSRFGNQAAPTQLPLQLAASHAPDVTRPAVLEAVKKDLGLDDSLEDIRSLVSVDVDPNAFTVKITADASDKNDAAEVANAFANADARVTNAETRARYANQAKRLQDELKGKTAEDLLALGVNANKVSTVQALAATAQPVVISATANVPDSPTSPKPLRDIAAATVLGFFVGILLAYGRSLFDRRLRDATSVEEVFDNSPVLARLRPDVFGHTGSAKDGEIDSLGPLDPLDGEAFRTLRENLRYLAIDRDLRTVVVTSAVPEEGKSTVAACLAMANAGAGKRTLLVEADLRRRVLAERFGIEEAPGLSDYLAGRNAPSEILQSISVPGATAEQGIDVPWGEGDNGAAPQSLVCITAGSAPPRPADVLSSERFAGFLQQVGKVYERVIIDCPPLLPVADTLEIAPRVDCMLMCVRLNRTTRDQAVAAKEALDRLPPRPVGIVLTDFSEKDSSYYRGYYRYGHDLAATTGEHDAVSKQPA